MPQSETFVDLKKKNVELNAAETAENLLTLRSLPRSIHMDINYKCNLMCPSCIRSDPRQEGKVWPIMDFSFFKKMADEVFPTAYRVMLSSGGEPLLHPRIEDMLKLCLRYETYPTIITNATLVDRKKAKLLAEAGVYVGISIDGASKKTYELLRYPAKWKRILKSLDTIRRVREEVGNPSFFPHLQAVIQRDNLHELPEFLDLARHYGLDLVKYARLLPFYPELEEKAVDPEAAGKVLVKTLRRASEYRIRIEVPDYGPTSVADDIAELVQENRSFPISLDSSPSAYYVTGAFVKYPGMSSPRCEMPWCETMITPEGLVVVGCCSTLTELGDLNRDDFTGIWNGSPYQEVRQRVNTSDPLHMCTSGRCPFRT